MQIFFVFVLIFLKISCKSKIDMVYLIVRRCGETGRRAGLKILWTNHPCRFESDRRHQRKNNPTIIRRIVFLLFTERMPAYTRAWTRKKHLTRSVPSKLFRRNDGKASLKNSKQIVLQGLNEVKFLQNFLCI